MGTQRMQNVKAELARQTLDALLVSSPYNISYLTSAFYFSTEEREAYLLATKNSMYLFTDGRYTEMAGKIKHVKLVEISHSSPFTSELQKIVAQETIKRLGFETNSLLFSEYQSIKKALSTSKTQFLPIKGLIENIRSVKGLEEIKTIKKACLLTDKTFTYILRKIKPGITERQVAFEIEYFMKKQGGDVAFTPIVAFGPHSSAPHHISNDQPFGFAPESTQSAQGERLKTNDIILLDFGAKVNNYCSDMTRTVFIGNIPDRVKKMYTTTLEAQQKAVEELYHKLIYDTSEIKTKDIDMVTRSYIESKGYPTIPHSLGHGVGLEVHESPRLSPTSKEVLKRGMVFTIEPGIYMPGIGGVRLEDTVLLEDRKLTILTKSSKAIVEI